MNAHQDDGTQYVVEKLGLLYPVPDRDPQTAGDVRAHYLALVQRLGETAPIQRPSQEALISQGIKRLKETFMFNNKLAARIGIVTILLGITIFFGGLWMTTAYAQAALPGDALYSVKTGLEGVQVSLSVDAERDANLHLRFADLRLDEMDRLVKKGRFDDLEAATGKFEYHIQEAIKSLALVAANDPEGARTMAISVNEALARSTGILTSLIAVVPETAQPAIEQALLSSESALAASEIEFTGIVDSMEDDEWLISGLTVLVDENTEVDDIIVVGDQVEVEGTINPDGTILAWEIKLEDDNLNENVGDDMNENDGDDMNENVGDDMNDNDNDDLKDIEFTGLVDSIEGDVWVINGVTVLVDEFTEIDDFIVVGDQVEVEGTVNPDGTVQAKEINLADDDMNENDGDDMNENDGDVLNENTGDDLNENTGDDMNENDGDDMNENDGDDMNENTGDDMNENDGDDLNENDGDDMNENDGGGNDND